MTASDLAGITLALIPLLIIVTLSVLMNMAWVAG